MKEYSFQKKYMGTEISVSLVTETESLAVRVAEETFSKVSKYEQRFSRFLPTSELSELNTNKELVVSVEFFAVLERSYKLYKTTNGIFNPLVQVARLGYTKDFTGLNNEQSVVMDDVYDIDFDTLDIDTATRRVKLQLGQQLDFGGILKGYLAEKLSREIERKYPECIGNIVNLGGDLHTRGVDEEGNEFVFDLYNPVTEKEISVPLRNVSLATSGTYKRSWKTVVGQKNHILSADGLSNPTSEIISASVIHSDGAVAEVYAKVLLIKGNDEVVLKSSILNNGYLLITKTGEMITNIV